MTEIVPVFDLLTAIEGRTFHPKQRDAWMAILEPHTQADALDAVMKFHSKPFKRPAYPGDIKALILDVEDVRVRRCGSLEITEQEWCAGPTGPAYAKLRRLIATGEWTAEEYRNYRKSESTLERHLASLGASIG